MRSHIKILRIVSGYLEQRWKYVQTLFFDAEESIMDSIITGNTRCKGINIYVQRRIAFLQFTKSEMVIQKMKCMTAYLEYRILFNSIHDRAERMSVHDVKRIILML